MKLPWKKENAAHKAPGGGKRRSFDLKAALTTRAVRVGGYSVAAAAIVIAIIVAANALVRALPAQWTQFDTTSSQLFSISDQTESVEGSLETPVTIHWIVQSGQEDATLETLLERYQALSENLTVEKVDPVVSPTFLEQYDVGSVYNNSLIVESEARYRYVDDLNAMASTGSAVGLTPERSAQISFTFHRNTETFPQVELVFYQYDSSNCLVSLDGEVVLLATREDVEAIVEAAAALIPET